MLLQLRASRGYIGNRNRRAVLDAVWSMAEVNLRVIDGADRGRVYAGLGTPVTIGREEGNIIQLNDDRVSRFHLKIPGRP